MSNVDQEGGGVLPVHFAMALLLSGRKKRQTKTTQTPVSILAC